MAAQGYAWRHCSAACFPEQGIAACLRGIAPPEYRHKFSSSPWCLTMSFSFWPMVGFAALTLAAADVPPPIDKAPPINVEKVKTFKEHTGWVGAVAFSPDSKVLATASADKTVKLSDVETCKLTATLTGHTDCVCAVA